MVEIGRAHDRYGSATEARVRRYGRGLTRRTGGALDRFRQVRVGLRRALAASRDGGGSVDGQEREANHAEAPIRVDAVPQQGRVQGHPAGRDNQDVPSPLRIAAAWSWRLIMVAVAGAIVLYVVGKLH